MSINPLLVTSYIVAFLVEVLAPLALAVFLARRFRAGWRFWFLGVLVFLVFQVLTRIPAVLVLQSLSPVREALKDPLRLWLFFFVLSFTAGLFEEGGRWLAFRYFVPPPERRWRNALMFGAGHGGLESIGIGLLALIGLANYLAFALLPATSLGISGEQADAIRAQFVDLQGWEPLLAWIPTGGQST
jgi:uncharacterized membrane protein YhfC